LPPDDKIRAIIDIKDLENEEFVKGHNIVLATKKGIIKKTALEDFSRPRTTGVIAITIVEGDELLVAKLTNGNSEIMMAAKSGRAIRFPEEKVRATGRGAIGVAGIDVDDDNDAVIGMICVSKEDKSRSVLVVSEKGYGKRTQLEEYPITNRGGKGVKTLNVTEKTGSLVGMLDVAEKEDLMITCKSGMTIRMPADGISELGRNTQGVKLIRLDDGDEIAAITKLDDSDEEENVENGENGEIDAQAVEGSADTNATAETTDGDEIASDVDDTNADTSNEADETGAEENPIG
jgi:DNA gyrase subunit A